MKRNDHVDDLNRRILRRYGYNPVIKWVHYDDVWYRAFDGYTQEQQEDGGLVKLVRNYKTVQELHPSASQSWVICEVAPIPSWDEWCAKFSTMEGLLVEYPQGRDYLRVVRMMNGTPLLSQNDRPTREETDRYIDGLLELRAHGMDNFFKKLDTKKQRDLAHQVDTRAGEYSEVCPRFTGPVVNGADSKIFEQKGTN